ncbi:MAG: DUF1461 domain-containing protein [Clostridia bacterium]|nr:DUF1461 domain-containing protein [Clostridia bacterium]
MHKRAFVLNTIGWFLLFFAMVMGCVRSVGLDPGRYYELQLEAGVHETAGISKEDLLQLDVWLARYLEGSLDDPNAEIEVYGQMQPAFNERELAHLADCRNLFSITTNIWLNVGLAVAGVALALYGAKQGLLRPACAWLAAAVIAVPVGLLGIWAAIDFNSAFNFFHRLLFTNDLWLLNPATDLLIRICPASMFASLGLRIGLRSAAVLLGLPAFLTLAAYFERRKRKQNENP